MIGLLKKEILAAVNLSTSVALFSRKILTDTDGKKIQKKHPNAA